MVRKLLYGLPYFLLAACADTSDKYRDIQHLEMPPTLAIEHTNSTPAETDSGKALQKKSLLDGIEQLVEQDGKPILQIKTRLARAWDLTETALQLANIETLDKNRNALTFQVNYDPDGSGFASLLNNEYDAEDYTLTLKDGIAGVEVHAELAKQAANGDSQEGDNDASAELIKRLHQVLQEKVLNRDN